MVIESNQSRVGWIFPKALLLYVHLLRITIPYVLRIFSVPTAIRS